MLMLSSVDAGEMRVMFLAFKGERLGCLLPNASRRVETGRSMYQVSEVVALIVIQ
jgi:hypothetical protein